jgi:hypothetical protein
MTKILLGSKNLKLASRVFFCIFHNDFLLLLGQLMGNLVFDQI